MRVETEHLIIRNYTMMDRHDMCEYMIQRVEDEFESYPGFTQDKADEEIEFRCKSDEFFAIELKAAGKVIGNIYLGIREFNTRELGYVLNKEYMSKGYGSEAAKRMLDFCFEKGVHRVYAETSPANIPSWKTMERIGMRREAHMIQNVSFKQDEEGNPIYWDTYVYGCVNPEPEHEVKDTPKLS